MTGHGQGFTKLVQKVIIMANGGALPANAETIQNQVAALVLARCTAQSMDFAKQYPLYLIRQRDTEKEING